MSVGGEGMKTYFQIGSAMVEDLNGNAEWVNKKDAEQRIKELEEENEDLKNINLDLITKLKEVEDILRRCKTRIQVSHADMSGNHVYKCTHINAKEMRQDIEDYFNKE